VVSLRGMFTRDSRASCCRRSPYAVSPTKEDFLRSADRVLPQQEILPLALEGDLWALSLVSD
jgi:hypothetical protein